MKLLINDLSIQILLHTQLPLIGDNDNGLLFLRLCETIVATIVVIYTTSNVAITTIFNRDLVRPGVEEFLLKYNSEND